MVPALHPPILPGFLHPPVARASRKGNGAISRSWNTQPWDEKAERSCEQLRGSSTARIMRVSVEQHAARFDRLKRMRRVSFPASAIPKWFGSNGYEVQPIHSADKFRATPEERERLRPIGRNNKHFQEMIRQMRELAVMADEIGFATFSTTEHHLHSEGFEASIAPLIFYTDLAARDQGASSSPRWAWSYRPGGSQSASPRKWRFSTI